MREQSIAVAKDWLALYRELHAKLLRAAAERRPAGEILRARPIEGDIDHEALTREIIARFPKILAALAE
jgi:acyl carrier protein phosphodiesterase